MLDWIMNLIIVLLLALVAAATIAALSIGTFKSTTSAQTTSVTPERVVNNTQEVSEIQDAINQSSFENRMSGNFNLLQRWSDITVVPSGSSRSLTVLCEPDWFPIAGGFKLGSPDLHVTGSHAFASPNGTLGWTINVHNAGEPLEATAAASVFCISEISTTGTPVPGDADGNIEVVISTDGDWSGSIMDSEFRSYTVDGSGDKTIPITCDSGGTYSVVVQKLEETGTLRVAVVRDGSVFTESSTTADYGVVSVSGDC